jgi:hypothetical protein
MPALFLLLVMSLGCVRPAATGSPPTPTPAPARGDAGAAVPDTLIDARLIADAPDRPVECTGADFDLGSIMRREDCETDPGESTPLPAAIRVTIDPPLRARVGTSARSRIVLENTSTSTVEVRLVNHCDVDRQIDSELFDARGKRADSDGACERAVGICQMRAITLHLAAGGRITFPVEIGTAMRHCEAAAHPLKPGRYRATLRANFLDQPVHAPLLITR